MLKVKVELKNGSTEELEAYDVFVQDGLYSCETPGGFRAWKRDDVSQFTAKDDFAQLG